MVSDELAEEGVFLLVWDTLEDAVEVHRASEAASLDEDRYEVAFVFDGRDEAERYADSYVSPSG